MPDRLLILIPLLLLLTACLSLVMSWVWRQISRVAIVAVIGLSLAILLATGLADFGWWSLPGISLIERLPLGWFREADQTVWFWFATSTWSLGLIVVMPNLQARRETPRERETILALLLTATLQAAVLSPDAFWQWAFISASSWLLAAIVHSTRGEPRERSTSPPPSALSSLIWLAIADSLWLWGLAGLTSLLGGTDLALLRNADLISSLDEGSRAWAVSDCLFLMLSLIIRCGLYPCMTWTGAASVTPRQSAWVIAGGLGSGAILLLRWGPLLAQFTELRLLLAGVGCLTAVLLPSIAWAQHREAQRLVRIASAQIGLCCVAFAVMPGEQRILHVWTSGSVLLTVFLVVSRSRSSQPPPRTVRSVRIIAFVLLGLGLGGVSPLIEAASQTKLLNPLLLLAALLGGQLVVAFLLFQSILRSSQRSEPTIDSATGLFSTTSHFAALGTAGVVAVPFLLDPTLRHWPVIGGIVVLIGTLAAVLWPENSPENAHLLPGNVEANAGTWRRLGQSEFFLPAIWQHVCVVPVRALAELVTLLNERLDGTLRRVPESYANELSDMAAQQDEEVGAIGSSLVLLLTLAVMLLATFITA